MRRRRQSTKLYVSFDFIGLLHIDSLCFIRTDRSSAGSGNGSGGAGAEAESNHNIVWVRLFNLTGRERQFISVSLGRRLMGVENSNHDLQHR